MRSFQIIFLFCLLLSVLPAGNELAAQIDATPGIEQVDAVQPANDVVVELDPIEDLPEDEPNGRSGLIDFIIRNWGELLVALLFIIEAIVRITPTQKDDAWFAWLKRLLDNIIPSRRVGGGTFKE